MLLAAVSALPPPSQHCSTAHVSACSCLLFLLLPPQDTSEISADLRKAEIFINNRGSGYLADGSWVGWENYRCVGETA